MNFRLHLICSEKITQRLTWSQLTFKSWQTSNWVTPGQSCFWSHLRPVGELLRVVRLTFLPWELMLSWTNLFPGNVTLIASAVDALSHDWADFRTYCFPLFGLFPRVLQKLEGDEADVRVMWCLMSSDVSWHIRDKLWPMLKHGSVILYVHGNQKVH